ncbi:hypothetical protein FN846DRAFT_249026 [Sphaerosporella brunnea]|uniref:Uncharacterized protein n=1 Tax=Sphaerosporella brunnea TaxID=1250544 RepID=A0A5J5FC28_9PEZI|nr:hypothetical protein FN846DRAFT_249026 [Sphaerosporella brunnea]
MIWTLQIRALLRGLGWKYLWWRPVAGLFRRKPPFCDSTVSTAVRMVTAGILFVFPFSLWYVATVDARDDIMIIRRWTGYPLTWNLSALQHRLLSLFSAFESISLFVMSGGCTRTISLITHAHTHADTGGYKLSRWKWRVRFRRFFFLSSGTSDERESNQNAG